MFDLRILRNPQRPGSARVVCVLISLMWIGAACAVIGEPDRISPEITGTLVGGSSEDDEAELRLNVVHRENPTLFSIQRRQLEAGAREFAFDKVDLEVAGREYSKVYRVYLHYRSGSADRVIWRGEFSRFDSAGAIVLDCDLSRPPRIGQPCQVRAPLQHAWLVETGRQTFDRLCAECHGDSQNNESPGAAPRKNGAPDLTRIAARRAKGFDAVEIAEWVEGTMAPRAHGATEMPIWGERLSDDYARYRNAEELVGATLDPVLVYLMSIQR